MELFPYSPNWENGIQERLAWRTDVIESHNATEERTALRAKPRRTLSYELLREGHDTQQLDSLLWRYQATQFILPIWTDPQRLAATLPQASTNIPADTDGYDFEAGQWAVLIQHGQLFEVVQIEQVNADSLDLSGQTLLEWPPGTLLYPGRPARLPADVNAQRLTAGITSGRLEFEIDPSAGTAEDWPDTYLTLPVFTRPPNWANGTRAGYLRKIQRIDYEIGDVYVDDLAEMPITVRTHDHQLRSREEITAWRKWLHARAGQANAFWQPQWQLDLTQTAAIGSTETALKVRSLDYNARYAADPGRRDIALLHKTGTWYYRRIDSVTTIGDDDVMTLDSALGIDADPGDFLLITWLIPARLESDEITINWLNDSVATSSIETRGLRQ